MARLKDFISYLVQRKGVMRRVEKQLLELQEKYETFFQEIRRVREAELHQLTEHILAARAGEGPALPEAFDHDLRKAEEEVDRTFDLKLRKLRSEAHNLERKAEQVRQKALKAEQAVRKKNAELDRQEEELKSRSEQVMARIEAFNDEIRQLARGWGFFANLFKMRTLQAQRAELDREQADLAARIETLRARWQQAESGHLEREGKAKEQWLEEQNELAALSAKIDHLERCGAAIRRRSAVEQVLFRQYTPQAEPAEGDPPCPRCQTPNPAENHFCRICARRLGEDRPDFSGSIVEISELNHHFDRFQEGIQACQELIGLVRGIISGLEAFARSVDEVQDSEKKYPLPKLEIDVPKQAVSYGEQFDALEQLVAGQTSVHPMVFAQRVQPLVEKVFSEDKIKDFFEIMGKELSRQASSQW